MPVVEKVLTLHVDQIVDGPEEVCVYCGAKATWLLATGADPEVELHCGEHAAKMIEAAAAVTRSLS